LRRDFGVLRAGLFGSAARGELRADSDIDVLVELERPLSFAEWEDLRARLEELFQRSVDVTTEGGLHALVRKQALAEAVFAA
jgi:predicted nucleotidyltransferase